MFYYHKISLVFFLVLFLLTNCSSVDKSEPDTNKNSKVVSVPVKKIPIRWEKVKKNENIYTILSHNSVSKKELKPILDALKKIYSGHIFQNQQYAINLSSDSLLQFFKLKSKDRCIIYTVSKDSTGLFIPLKEKLELRVVEKVLSTSLELSLYNSIQKMGESSLLAAKFIEIFSWDINWFFDPRPDDSFKILYEMLFYKDEFLKYGKILACYYNNSGKEFYGYYFSPDSLFKGYFNNDGVSLQKTFLKAPLVYRRISSKFSYSRLHPILKRKRPHLGVDYAAPIGTPVKAAANGKVVYAKRNGGYGKCIKLKHQNSYITHYGHLSGYARKVRRNASVKQGQIIGYVGSTGLSTGPHLDYRVKKGKRFINPLKIKSSPTMHVSEKHKLEFESTKQMLFEKLNMKDEIYADKN